MKSVGLSTHTSKKAFFVMKKKFFRIICVRWAFFNSSRRTMYRIHDRTYTVYDCAHGTAHGPVDTSYEHLALRTVRLGVGPYFAVKGLNFFRYFAGKEAKFRENFAEISKFR
jgi:hypothetical protein